MKRAFKTDWEVMKEEEEKHLRDAWQTPPQFMQAIKNCFGIHPNAIDACADASNAQFENYFDEEMNALGIDWVKSARDAKLALQFWCNPGYSDVTPWVDACAEAASNDGVAYLLTHDNWNAEWFRRARSSPWRSATYLLCPRIPFIPAPGIKQSTPRGNNMLHVFNNEREHGRAHGDARIYTLNWKDYLIS